MAAKLGLYKTKGLPRPRRDDSVTKPPGMPLGSYHAGALQAVCPR
jgi:hypothetical protein